MLSQQRIKKEQIVNTISERIDTSVSFVVLNYQHFKSKDFVDLRAELKENNAELKVFKNTLFLKTLEKRSDQNLKTFQNTLKGQNIFLFSYQKPLLPVKIFSKFCKEINQEFLPIVSVIENSVLTDKNQLTKLVNFETKENMYAYTGFILKLPLIKLLFTLKSIKTQKKSN